MKIFGWIQNFQLVLLVLNLFYSLIFRHFFIIVRHRCTIIQIFIFIFSVISSRSSVTESTCWLFGCIHFHLYLHVVSLFPPNPNTFSLGIEDFGDYHQHLHFPPTLLNIFCRNYRFYPVKRISIVSFSGCSTL